MRTTTSAVHQYTWWQDLGMLVKFRLSLFVVISAVLAYLIVAQGSIPVLEIGILAVGGFFITSAANALNEILEKDYDRLMSRTSVRPLAAERMTVTQAMLIAGLSFVLGIILLAFFNPLASVLGALSVVIYAFIYTPMKRISSVSVLIGAIPGALPVMIGVVALEGRLTYMALILFAIQFFWQFPHFWSIGFLGFDDYQKAGFKVVPAEDGQVHRSLGWQSVVYALFLVPCSLAPALLGLSPWGASAMAVVLSLGYAWFGWQLHVHFDRRSARYLMFYSFAYLPLILVNFYLGALWML